MTPRRPHAGFTLSEVLVSLAVIGFILASVLGVVLAQKGALEGTEQLRGTNETGKDTIVELERALRRAGFGIEPRFAFDFRWFRCPVSEQLNGEGGRPTCRDRRDASDRLVFSARSPYYRVDPTGTNGCVDVEGCPTGRAWRLKARTPPPASPPDLTVAARKGDVFLRGQTLLAVCPGARRWTMATVDAALVVEADADVRLVLRPTDAAIPYFENALEHGCFGAGATVFEVTRSAYSVESYDPDGTGPRAPVPWLVLDQGLDLDGDGSDPWTEVDPDDLVALSPGVEDLQVAYLLERASGGVAPDSNADFVTGDDPATSALPEEPDPAAPAPDYATPTSDPRRGNLNPANIRGVRVALVVRTERGDPSRPAGWAGDPLPLRENGRRTLSAVERGRHRRATFEATVVVRNLRSRGMFVF